jgi:hypothetical protein
MTEEVEIIEDHSEYYLKPENELYAHQKSWTVPSKVFLAYVKVRGGRQKLPKSIRDKKMHVARYHLNEGEVHKFNEDGLATVRKKAG